MKVILWRFRVNYAKFCKNGEKTLKNWLKCGKYGEKGENDENFCWKIQIPQKSSSLSLSPPDGNKHHIASKCIKKREGLCEKIIIKMNSISSMSGLKSILSHIYKMFRVSYKKTAVDNRV